MLGISENYHLRKYFLKREQVPTLGMIKEKMSPALSAVFFKSMTPRLKELAGLEPPLKGGGGDWYVPPDELLEGRAVLKPIRKEVLCELNHQGIETIGKKLFQKHQKQMYLDIEQALLDSEISWRNYVTATTRQLWEDLVATAKKNNSEQIMKDFNNFIYLYRQSLGKIEILFHESAVAEIKNTQEKALHEMQNKYAAALEHQATLLYDQYEKKLMEEKTRLKFDFMQKLEINRMAMTAKIHDLNVDKHMAVEKLKQCLQHENLACGIYVALKEREECLKETEEFKDKHKEKVKMMTDSILSKDFEIRLEREKEKEHQEFCKIWQKKVCHIVKSFQTFVAYCLNMLPEHAEFFINMEKLMLLQLNETLEDPTAASIIGLEEEQFQTPIPQPKPFYLFCDRGYKAKVEQDLCPKHSGTSSTSGLPVMIINKRCLYAACDNFDQFTNKIKEFIHGDRGEDADFTDDLIYENFVPVKYGPSQRLLDIKLESSLLQVLQQEIVNVHTDENIVPIKCRDCELPWCSCPPRRTSVDYGEKTKRASSLLTSSRASCHKLQSIGRSVELDHEREPKWDSFCTHVEPKKCSCAKTVKKHLKHHLPVYMRHMKYGPPEIPGYEMCSVKELKALVKEARKEILPPIPPKVPSMSKGMSTQCNDSILEAMCTCYSDHELSKCVKGIKHTGFSKTCFGAMSSSFMAQTVSSFATARAHSLRKLVEEYSKLEYIFKKDDCHFE